MSQEGIIVKDAHSEILAIKEQVFLMGANDSEGSKFDEILLQLDNKEITEDQAIGEANKILFSKQDYH